MRCRTRSPGGWLPYCLIRKCLTLVLAVGGVHGYAPRVDHLLSRRLSGRARFPRTLVMAAYSSNSSTPSSVGQPRSPKARKTPPPEPLVMLPDLPPEPPTQPPSRRPSSSRAQVDSASKSSQPPPPPAQEGGMKGVGLGEERVYLYVAFQEKDQVKALGARWDAQRRAWYVHPSRQALCERWLAPPSSPPSSPPPRRNDRPSPSNPEAIPSATGGQEPSSSSPSQRIFLEVPFADKDVVKSLGARWDRQAKQWYIPSPSSPSSSPSNVGPLSAFTPWLDTRGPLSELKHEDRGFGGNELCVDLIPSTCWFTNVRSAIEEPEWARLRRFVVTRTQGTCECCGRVMGPTSSPTSSSSSGLEAHERWQFLTQNPFALHPRRIQRLRRLVALCRDCHEVTHMGLAQLQGRGEEALAHLRRVTGMSAQEAQEHVREAFDLWGRRSRVEWELDVSLLTDNGIPLKEEVGREERSRRAQQELRRRGGAAGGHEDQGETWM